MSAQAVYVEQDGKQFRVMELTIPVVINDFWHGGCANGKNDGYGR